MSDRRQLICDLMAELTGRFEDLATLTISQHQPDHVDPDALNTISQGLQAASALIDAAQALMEQPNSG